MSERRPLILCIDDDPDILSFLEIVLEGEGYAFAGAESAEEGLRVYQKVDPDAVIVDLMMEEVDAGATFVKELQRLGNTAPVFLLSSVGDHYSATVEYASMGLAGVLQKPLVKARLLAVLKARLG